MESELAYLVMDGSGCPRKSIRAFKATELRDIGGEILSEPMLIKYGGYEPQLDKELIRAAELMNPSPNAVLIGGANMLGKGQLIVPVVFYLIDKKLYESIITRQRRGH